MSEIARWGAGEPGALVTALWWSRDNRWLAARVGGARSSFWNASTHEPWSEFAPREAVTVSSVEFVCGGTAALLWMLGKEYGQILDPYTLRCVSLSDGSMPELWKIGLPASALHIVGLRDDLSRIVVDSPQDGWWALDRGESSRWRKFAAEEVHRSSVRMRDDDTVDLITDRAWVRARLERDRVVIVSEYLPLEAGDLRLELNELGVLAHNARSSRAWLRRKDGAVFYADLPAHHRHLSRLASEAAVYALSSETGQSTVIDLEAGERIELEMGEGIEQVELSPDATRFAVSVASGDVRVFAIERR
ncbi:MAG: hypothetical protein U0269_31200 [Polyangiales bacterium]